MEQLSWSAVVAHVDVVMRISEESRVSGGSQFLAILYDDLLRRSMAYRAAKRDPELHLETEFTKVNKEVLDLARSRLSQVLMAVGVKESNVADGGFNSAATASTESVLAKQAAAADALTRKAESAVKHLAQQQQQLEDRRMALESQSRPQQQDGNHGKKRDRWGKLFANKGNKGKGGKGKGKF